MCSIDCVRGCLGDLENLGVKSLVFYSIILNLQAGDACVKNYSNDSDAPFAKCIQNVWCDRPCRARHLDTPWKSREKCLIVCHRERRRVAVVDWLTVLRHQKAGWSIESS